MDQELEDLVARASNPRWIPAIYEYCDRRCKRCIFSDRCFTFAEQAQDNGREAAKDVGEAVAASLQRAVELLHTLAEREGIDPNELSSESDKGEDAPAAIDDSLVVKAREYSLATYRLLQPLDSAATTGARSASVRDAIDSILWLSTPIASKVFRAVSGLEHSSSPDDHPTQNDTHGSAKIARLMIAESLAAWRVLNEEGRAPMDSPTRAVATTLEGIEQELADRIPRAMEFVRPGFDESVPGTVRPWSLTAGEKDGDRRLLAAEGVLAKLGAFGRRFLFRKI